MAQVEVKKLDAGDPFPALQLRLVDGSSLTLPDAAKYNWSVFLVYRGHW